MLHLPELLLGPLSQLDLATPGPLSGLQGAGGDWWRCGFFFVGKMCGGKDTYKYPVSKRINRWWFHIFLYFHLYLLAEMVQFDWLILFQMGWFNHHLIRIPMVYVYIHLFDETSTTHKTYQSWWIPCAYEEGSGEWFSTFGWFIPKI